jgi:transcriptional regulator with XRE-family HTH domain
MTDKKLPLRDRRRLLRAFRKLTGLTLVELGKLSGLSNPMLSQFENGKVNLSAGAASRLLAVIGDIAANFVPNPITEDRAKSSAKMVLVQKIAAKLGASVALSTHSPDIRERLTEYALKPPITTANYTPQELAEIARETLEIAQQVAHEAAVLSHKEEYWRAELDKASAQIDGLKDILGLREKKILTEESEQQKVDALGLERIPPIEEETLRAEIEQRGKPKGETDPLEPSKAQYEKEMREHGFDVRLKRKGKE